MLEDLSSNLLLGINKQCSHAKALFAHQFSAIQHLGLELSTLLEETGPASPLLHPEPNIAIPAELESALRFSPLKQYFLGSSSSPSSSITSTTTECYSTRPPQVCFVNEAAYYTRLDLLVRFICQFKEALHAGPLIIVTDPDDEARRTERRLGSVVRLRLLGHYTTTITTAFSATITSSSNVRWDGHGGPVVVVVDGETGSKWQLTSPEKCPEALVLGSEPRQM
ncbi:hypothetical protein C8A03DRAFT_34856 [Achaetomium macrosporum]|uniref:Uncharacterized protein n=1 Tax=Achaetomium macrosporum TaxID=79813 RepID=A0AAN7C848_9PEZI|nr:hypothetical protein C8A03DRAFT_34856 [Achaetomium macrosporum]